MEDDMGTAADRGTSHTAREAVVAATRDLEARQATLDALISESNRIFQATSEYRVADGPNVMSFADRLRARARREELNQELALARADVDDAERALERARQSEN